MQRFRIEIALDRAKRLQVLVGQARSASKSRPTASAPDARTRCSAWLIETPFGKTITSAPGFCASNAADDLDRRLQAPALEALGVELAGPRIEDLNHIGAGPKLTDQMLRRRRYKPSDDFTEQFRLIGGQRFAAAWSFVPLPATQ